MTWRPTAEIVADLRECDDGSEGSFALSLWLIREAADRLEALQAGGNRLAIALNERDE